MTQDTSTATGDPAAPDETGAAPLQQSGAQQPRDPQPQDQQPQNQPSEQPSQGLARQPVDAELLQRILEGALLAAGKPLSVQQLAELFDPQERPDNDTIRLALAAIQTFHAQRGFELREVASGYRFQVVGDVGPWVSRLWEEKPQRYSRALLETLALIAYRQPITRGDIEDIRGVAVSSNIVKTLLEREWVRVVGHKDVPGRPAMYATTRKFLDYFNLKNLDDLPSLAELRDLESFNAELALEGADTVLPTEDGDTVDEPASDSPNGDAAVDDADTEPSDSEPPDTGLSVTQVEPGPDTDPLEPQP